METPTYPGPASMECPSNYTEVQVSPYQLPTTMAPLQLHTPSHLHSLTDSRLPGLSPELSLTPPDPSSSQHHVLQNHLPLHADQPPGLSSMVKLQRQSPPLHIELRQFYSDSAQFSDTIIVCKDGTRSVHRLLLAAASPYLCSLLQGQSEIEDPAVVILSDFSLAEMEVALTSMYGFYQTQVNSDLEKFLFNNTGSPSWEKLKQFQFNNSQKNAMNGHFHPESESTNSLQDGVKIKTDLDDYNNSEDDSDWHNNDDIDFDVDTEKFSKNNGIDKMLPGKVKDGRYVPKPEAECMAANNFVKCEDTKEYGCIICEGKYRSKCINAIRTHIFSHLKIYIYKCNKCGEMFRQLANFNRHLRRHKRLEAKGSKSDVSLGNYHNLETNILVDPEEAKGIIESYIRYLPGKREHSCKLCNYCNKVKKEVYIHCLSRHLKITLYKCVQCEKEFKQKCNYLKHMKTEHNVNIIQEKEEEMTQAEKLSQSSDITTDDITKVSKDQLNGKLISFQQGLKLVEKLIKKCPDDGAYICIECNRKFSKIIGNCREHIWRVHYNVYLYRCEAEGCDKKLRKLTDFKEHVKQHQIKLDKKRELLESHEMALAGDSKYHLLTDPIDVNKERGFEIAGLYFYHDPTISLYKCKLCSFTHNRIQGTRNHVLANHLTQVFLYRCAHCGKRYRYETQFKLHMAIHEEGKFVCSQCGKQLVTKRYLDQHEKTAHGSQKYFCSEPGCDYKGKTPVQMDRHTKVYHSKDQSNWHYCEICAKAFPYLNDLKVHLIRCLEGKSMAFRKQRFTKYFTKQNEESFICLVCNNHLKSHRSVIEHIKKTHNIMEGAVKYLKCQAVGCKFKTIKHEKLVRHMGEAGHLQL